MPLPKVPVYTGCRQCTSIDYLYTASLSERGAEIYVPLHSPDEVRQAGGAIAFLSIMFFDNLGAAKSPDEYPHFGDTYLLDRLDESCLALIAEGYLKVVIDYSGEAAVINDDILRRFHDELARRQLDAADFALITSNRAFHDCYSKWCEGGHTAPIRVFSYNHAVYHYSGTLRAASSHLFDERLERLTARRDQGRSRRYVCLNNMPRVQRFFILSWLCARKFEGAGFISCLQGLDPRYRDPMWSDIKALDVRNEIDEVHFDGVLERIPILADADATTARGALSGGLGGEDIYANSYFSLVTESDFTRGEINRITEKALKPMTGLHPYIVLGSPHSLKLLREEQFDVFADVFGDDYDELLGLEERSARVTTLIGAALEVPASAWRDTWMGIEERLVANYKRLWSKPADAYTRLDIHREFAAFARAEESTR